ncbi:MAG: glycosyltransferase family 2 protein [Bacteroidetes bacterium]|nr:MAG: glycosyltransferase family 2 protein [Bacteroidota bacterium]
MESKDQPLVSFITLNYNQTPVTCEFLESTRSLTYKNFEIIVVDNNSKEDPTDYIQANYPEVTLIRSEKNLGFTGGNNLGMKYAKGDYFFIINNDTEVTPGMLEPLLKTFEQDPEIGVVCPKIRFYDQPELIQYAGYTEINPITGRNVAIGMFEVDNGQYDQGSYTEYAHGAAMLVKREVAEKTGGFAELFFIYYEELDWSARIKRAGYKIYYQPESLIYHKESVTMGRESPIKAYYHNRNRILFMRRNTKPAHQLMFTLWLLFAIVPKKMLTYMLKFQTKHIQSFVRALTWHLKHRNLSAV